MGTPIVTPAMSALQSSSLNAPTLSRQPSLTIVRIKRKRTDEPLDALVLDLPRKKSKEGAQGGAGLFKYAETVEQAAFFSDERSTMGLHKRITDMSRTPPESQIGGPTATTSAPLIQPSATPPQIRVSSSEPTAVQDISARRVSNLPRTTARQYSIVKQKSASHGASTPLVPPVIRSLSGAASTPGSGASTPSDSKHPFTLYDAVPLSSASTPARREQASSSSFASMEPEDMSVFASMVEDYLKLNDVVESPKKPTTTTSLRRKAAVNRSGGNVSDDEYVYDVFYYRKKTSAGQPGLGESLGRAANVGLIMIQPEDDVEFLDDDSDDDSDAYDSEDPDSNNEDNPRNDYPEDEYYSASDEETPQRRYVADEHEFDAEDAEYRDFDGDYYDDDEYR